MQQSLSLNGIGSMILGALHRYHVVLFAIFAVGGLAAALYLLNSTFITASTPTDTTSAGISIDQAPLNKINTMHTSQQLNSPDDPTHTLPTNGRINPLVTP